MKKFLSILLTSLVLSMSVGCGNSGRSLSLYEQGIEVITMMTEMSDSEPYLNALSGSQELKDKVLHVGTKTPNDPEVVYEIKVEEAAVLQMLNINNLSDFSENLQKNLRNRIYSVIASQINASEGVAALAASSACTANQSFINDHFSGNTLYLYLYKDGAPVLVSFTSNEDGIVSVTGSFLFKDTSDLSKDAVYSWFKNYATDLQVIDENSNI